MKLSERTLDIFKYFSVINPSIYVKSGNQISTISPSMAILARATVAENFEQEFAIHNLSRFLGTVTLFDQPEFEFQDKFVTITSDKQRVNYTYADPSMLVVPPSKDIKFPDPEVEFNLTAADLVTIQKAGAVLQAPEIAIVGEDGVLSIRAVDSKNSTADVFAVDVGDATNDFSVLFKPENLKLVPGDYKVSVTSKGIARFETTDITFWIATQTK